MLQYPTYADFYMDHSLNDLYVSIITCDVSTLSGLFDTLLREYMFELVAVQNERL